MPVQIHFKCVKIHIHRLTEVLTKLLTSSSIQNDLETEQNDTLEKKIHWFFFYVWKAFVITKHTCVYLFECIIPEVLLIH